MFISNQEYMIFNSESCSVQSERERVKVSFKVSFLRQFFMNDHPQPILWRTGRGSVVKTDLKTSRKVRTIHTDVYIGYIHTREGKPIATSLGTRDPNAIKIIEKRNKLFYMSNECIKNINMPVVCD